MRHVVRMPGEDVRPYCSDALADGDALVLAAMESGCDRCRALLNVQPVAWSKPKVEGEAPAPINVSPGVPPYVPEPLVRHLEPLADIVARRDGRS